MRHDFPLEEIQRITGYDPWFLAKSKPSFRPKRASARMGLPKDAKGLRALKSMGFSDARWRY